MAGSGGTSRRGGGGAESGSGTTRSRRGRTAPKSGNPKLSDGKLYYRIGEVAEITGVKPHVLRYWETEFRWMAPPKSRSKQRLYRRKDIDTIFAIKRLLYDERYTIAGARQQLRESGLARALEVGPEPAPSEAGEAGASESRPAAAAAIAELHSGYRRIRQEIRALRELL
jgi:DNA-binding transcriptional MerR regulator